MEGLTLSESASHNVTVSKAFVVVSTTTSVLSLIGTILIAITYFLWKEIQTSSRRILLYISIADFVTALGNMFSVLHVTENNIICEIQSFVTTTSCLCSFFWSTFMAVYLFIAVALRKQVIAERMLYGFHVFAWGVPCTISGVALGFGKLGNSEDLFTAGWCWIKSMEREEQLKWMWITGKGWEILTYTLIIFFYGILKWRIQRDIKFNNEQFTTMGARHAAAKADRKLTFVPIVFIMCRFWGTLRFLLYVFTEKTGFTYLVYLQGIGDNAQGAANFMLFCFFTEKFQKRFKAVCCSCFCKTNERDAESSQSIPGNEVVPRPRAAINERTSLGSCDTYGEQNIRYT